MIKNPKSMHPGQVLAEIYVKEMDLNQSQLGNGLLHNCCGVGDRLQKTAY